jgi:GntR family transcriptional regulator
LRDTGAQPGAEQVEADDHDQHHEDVGHHDVELELLDGRGTIRSALAALRREGLIDGGQGRPPVVRDVVASQPFENLVSFSAWAEQLGRTPGQRTIEVARRAVNGPAALELGLEPGTMAVDVLRVRLLDGEPVMVERATFVEAVGRLLFDFDPDSGSIYAYLTGEGVDLRSARHTFDAVPAGDLDAEFLGIPVGTPLLRERRRATSVGLPHDLRILKETS